MKNPDPRRVYQQVVLRLAEKINSGEIPDGSLLPSARQLMEMFGVSRTAVREAMAALQGSGLIAVRPNRRALVTRLNSMARTPYSASDPEHERMLLEVDMSRERRKQVIDQAAACVILQSFLDHGDWTRAGSEK